MDEKSWRDVSLGDTLEEILLPKRPLTRRERMNLPDEVSTPPSSPCSLPSPPKLQPATRKSRKRNLINWSLYLEYFNYWIIHYQSLLRWGQISNIERVTAIFISQGGTKSCNLKIFKYQYFSEFLRYGPEFLHVIINLLGFNKTFRNMISHGAPSLISRGGPKWPPLAFSWESETSPLVGLRMKNQGTEE